MPNFEVKLFEIMPNFAYFWPLKFFAGKPPNFLDPIIELQSCTDHGAKFCDDRPTELGDSMARTINKKHLQ